MTGGAFNFACVLLLALTIDLIAGDPVWMPHPVRWIGRSAVFFEKVLRPVSRPSFTERFCGAVFALVIVGLVVLTNYFVVLNSFATTLTPQWLLDSL